VARTESGAWWLDRHADDRAKRIRDVLSRLWEYQAPWRQQLKLNARFYGDNIEHAMSPRTYRGRQTPGAKAQRLTLNITKRCTDTFVAMLTHDDPKVSCVTTGAEWDLREKAELTEQALEGVFQETDFRVVAQAVAYDSAKYEPGWAYFFEDDTDQENPRPGVERAFPWEVIVSDEDALYGKPRTYYRLEWQDKGALKEKYPDLEIQIDRADTSGFFDDTGSSGGAGADTGVELVRVTRAWHLPRTRVQEPEDGEDLQAGAGLYVVTLGELVLEEQPYYDLTPPLEPLYRQRPGVGIHGVGLPEELSPIQRDRNVVSQRIQRGIHLMGQPHILAQRGANINTNKIDNQSGSIWEYSGSTPPVSITPSPAAPEMFQREVFLGQQGYEITGISPQLAQGVRPAGVNSGEAQRVHADIAAAVFKPSYLEYQDFKLRSARQFIRLMNRIAKKNPEFFVKPGDADVREAIVWTEATMRETQYTLRLAATNQLEDDPDGRADLLQDLINGGTIPQQDGMRLIAQGRQDLLGYLKEQPWYASYQYTQKAITNILRGKKPLPPVGFINLQAALTAAQTAYLDAAVGGCPQDRLDALTRWAVQVQGIIDRNKPPPPPAPVAPPGAAPGAHQLGAGLPPGALPPPKPMAA
jgi:hypothetical protein